MAKTGLTQVELSQTFQVWLDKTNEIVDILGSDALTASALGDTTNGNATLVGRFTVDNITVTEDIITSSITPPEASVKINGKLESETTDGRPFEIISTAGPRMRYNNSPTGSGVVWETGFADANGSDFIINSGAGQAAKLNLSSSGNLTTFGSITAGAGGFFGNLTGDVVGNASTASEWETTREITFSGDISANFDLDGSQDVAVTLTINDDAVELGTKTSGDYVKTLTAGTGVSINNSAASAEGAVSTISIGQSVGTGDNVLFNSVRSDNGFAGNALFHPDVLLSTGSNARRAGVLALTGRSGSSGGTAWGSVLFADYSLGINSPSIAAFYGDSTASRRVDVVGPLDVRNSSDNTLPGTITSQGNIRSRGDVTAFYSASDKRLKDNINIIDGALDKVNKISGYTFNYKNKPELRIAGVIAQELKEVLPEAVYTIDEELDGEKTDVLAVRYDSVVPLLIEAIKELKSEIEELKNK